jgi:hypothetical protein
VGVLYSFKLFNVLFIRKGCLLVMHSDGFVESVWIGTGVLLLVYYIAGRAKSRASKYMHRRDNGGIVTNASVSIIISLTAGFMLLMGLLAVVSNTVRLE